MARWTAMAMSVVLGGMVVGSWVGAEETIPRAEDASALTGSPQSGAGVSEAPAINLVTMEFQDASLKDVLKVFSKQTGINVIAGADIADQPVTVYLEGVNPLDALDQILASANLVSERPANSDIYIVRSKIQGHANTITRVYRLKYARVSESIFAKAAAAFGSRTPFEASLTTSGSTGGSSSSSSSGSTSAAGSGAAAGGSSSGSGSSAGAGIDLVLKPLLTANGQIVVDGRTNSLVMTDVPENFPRLEAALAALDVRTKQIMVDAELIETKLSKLKDLGMEWGSGSEGSFFTLTPAQRSTKFPFGDFFGRDPNATSGELSTALTLSQFGTLNTAQAVGVLQALQNDTDSKILARPRVLTLDNESALIRLTAEEAVGFTTSNQAVTGTTGSTPERQTTGVVLVVTPQINAGDDITMVVEPSVTKTVPSSITAPSGNATPRDPKTRSARAIVRVRSGETLVIGGLIDRSESKVVQRVPVLSSIPIIGEMFKDTETDNSTSELIVFLTPHILQEGAEARVASVPPAPFATREQEGLGSKQEAIEQTLNRLER